MVEILLLATIFISFFCALFVIPFWIRKARQENLVGKDMHKQNKNEVAEGGGVGVMFGFSIGVLLYLAINTFYFQRSEFLISIFAILTTLFIATMLGSIDDLLGWKKGLSKSMRIVMMLFAAIPLMVINAGESILLGIDFGLVFPLFLIPLGIVGAATTFNFLAGYNGLEASQGILILSALSVVTFLTGNSWLSVIALCMVAALTAFYIFNKYPAKIFPGDTLTYPVGALIAVIAILGNIEKIAIFFFIPYILETILKLKGWLRKESFAKLNKDGSLELPYTKMYGLEHLAIKILKKIKPSKKVYETDVVYLINGFQIIIILLGFWIFVI
ncbi:MAG TPA: glycosyl transferase family 4 [Candidatus Nanoarchaeia archaeon]|nr:glycosyl transferase family 4 [Candidatus Nanoarchaeia archaeon]